MASLNKVSMQYYGVKLLPGAVVSDHCAAFCNAFYKCSFVRMYGGPPSVIGPHARTHTRAALLYSLLFGVGSRGDGLAKVCPEWAKRSELTSIIVSLRGYTSHEI